MSALGGKAVLAAGSEWEKRAQAGPAIAETENRAKVEKVYYSTGKRLIMSTMMLMTSFLRNVFHNREMKCRPHLRKQI